MGTLSKEGYIPSSLVDIITEMENDAKDPSRFGVDVDVSEESILGQLIGLFAIQIEKLESNLNELYNQSKPNQAEGSMLDDLSYVTGITRKARSKTTITNVLFPSTTSGIVIPAGTVIKDADDNRFITLEEQTTTPVVFFGNTVYWAFVNLEAEEYGPISVDAGVEMLLDTPISGNTSVVTTLKASVGSEQETDDELRIRRNKNLAAGGNGTMESIVTAVSNINGVTSVVGFENSTDQPQSRGTGNTLRPPHSFELIIEGGSDESITQTILFTKGGGIQAFGELTTAINDSNGNPQIIGYTRPVTKDVYAYITIVPYEEEVLPTTYKEDIKAAVSSLATDILLPGKDIITDRLKTAVFNIEGIAEVKMYVSVTSLQDASTLVSSGEVSRVEISSFETARIKESSIDVAII